MQYGSKEKYEEENVLRTQPYFGKDYLCEVTIEMPLLNAAKMYKYRDAVVREFGINCM